MTTEELVKDVLKNPDNLFKALGTAFRPDLKHFTDLSEEEQKGRLREIPILTKNHDDWPAPFNTIPRSATVFFGPPPASGSKPILPPGESFAGEGYLTLTTDDGIHVRHGFRYDDIDGYYTYVILTIKRVSEDEEEILGQILDYADAALFVAATFFPKLKTGSAILSLINGLEEVYRKLPDVDPLLLKTQKLYKKPKTTPAFSYHHMEVSKFDLPKKDDG